MAYNNPYQYGVGGTRPINTRPQQPQIIPGDEEGPASDGGPISSLLRPSGSLPTGAIAGPFGMVASGYGLGQLGPSYISPVPYGISRQPEQSNFAPVSGGGGGGGGGGIDAGSIAGNVVGSAVGNAVAGPIGGFIGGAIGGAICFAGGTMIRMEDGSEKQVESLKLGDVVKLGGEVVGIGQAYAQMDLCEYRGERVTAAHAVFEDGGWMRVGNSRLAKRLPNGKHIVYPIATEKFLLVTRGFIAADFSEIQDTFNKTEDERIEALNADKSRNLWLLSKEQELFHAT